MKITLLTKEHQRLLKPLLAIAFTAILAKKLYFVVIREDASLMLPFCAGIFLLFLGSTRRVFLSLVVAWAIPELIQKASALQYESTGEALSWQTLQVCKASDAAGTILQYPTLIHKITEYALTCLAFVTLSFYIEIKIIKSRLRLIATVVGPLALFWVYFSSINEVSLPKYGYGGIKYFIWSIHNKHESPYLITKDAMETQPLNVSCPTNQPNIFIVMEESTFNPYADQDFSKYIPESESLKKFFQGNLLKSPMHVYVYGGGTILSEFAFLSGIPHTAYSGNSGIVPSDRLNGIESFSLQTIVRQCGYKTIALSPEINTKAWKYDVFHSQLKTEELFAIGKDNAGKRFEEKVDKILFDRLKEIIKQEKGDKPLLVYTVTVSQHGPYSSIEDYMTRLEKSAEDFNNLGNDLGPNWVYGWFGDHQPHVENYLTQPRTSDKYLTFSSFFTKNPSIAPFSGFNKNKPIDIPFMSYLLLKNLGFKMKPLDSAYKTAIDECQENLQNCSEKTKEALYRAYLKYIIK